MIQYITKYVSLTLCTVKTLKLLFWSIVKTQMKCCTAKGGFSSVATLFAKMKTFLKDRSDMHHILGECLLISSLPGKALKTLVDIARLAEI